MKKVNLSELLLEEAGYDYGMPDYTCSECGYHTVGVAGEPFRTIKYETMDGTEYDLECPQCGSTEVCESIEEAFDRLLSRYESAMDRITELEAAIKEIKMGGDF